MSHCIIVHGKSIESYYLICCLKNRRKLIIDYDFLIKRPEINEHHW